MARNRNFWMRLVWDEVMPGLEGFGDGEFRAWWLLAARAWCQERPAGTLPDDDVLLARYSRRSGKEWRKVKSIVLGGGGWVLGSDGRWHLDWMELEYGESLALAEVGSNRAKKGARARWATSVAATAPDSAAGAKSGAQRSARPTTHERSGHPASPDALSMLGASPKQCPETASSSATEVLEVMPQGVLEQCSPDAHSHPQCTPNSEGTLLGTRYPQESANNGGVTSQTPDLAAAWRFVESVKMAGGDGVCYTAEEVKGAWLSLEASKDAVTGCWPWGKNRWATDWRVALESRLNDRREMRSRPGSGNGSESVFSKKTRLENLRKLEGESKANSRSAYFDEGSSEQERAELVEVRGRIRELERELAGMGAGK